MKKILLLASLFLLGLSVQGQALRDSALARIHRRHLPARTGYLRRDRVQVLTMPNAYGRPVVGEAEIASQVGVLDTHTPSWAFVIINGVKGWVPRRDITSTLDSVSGTVNWKYIAEYPDYAALMVIGERPPTALTPAALARIKQHPALRDASRKH